MNKIPKEKPIQILSVGTRILLKDVMDQFLRSLGEVRTFYASKMSSAVEAYAKQRPNIIFCEPSFPEGSALEFINHLGGLDPSADQYFVLAVEEANPHLMALAIEMGIDEILVKPFSIDAIHEIVERYLEKQESSSEDWIRDLRNAKQSFVEKRFQEADDLYSGIARGYSHHNRVLLECAQYFLRRNYPHEAKPLLETILASAPDNARALHLMGQTQRKLGQYRAAILSFLRAADLSPLNALRLAEIAETYLSLSEEQLQEALKLDPESSSFILTKARYQLVRKDYLNMVVYLDAKRTYLSEAARKESDTLIAIGKKMGGFR